MKWVTRRHIRINRTASAWFIRRFVDPMAEFFFVDEGTVSEVQETQGAIGFDAPGARYPHKDEHGRCSFEALVEEHLPNDPAMRDLAWIVHCADYSDDIKRVPEAAGLRAISQGFPMIASHDHDIVARASFLYDSLYAVLKARRERQTESGDPRPGPSVRAPSPGSIPRAPSPGPIPRAPSPGPIPRAPSPVLVPRAPSPGPIPRAPSPGPIPRAPSPGPIPRAPSPRPIPRAPTPEPKGQEQRPEPRVRDPRPEPKGRDPKPEPRGRKPRR